MAGWLLALTQVDLGIARAGNKGMCGVSVRWHDATLAFIAAHFHSDSHGRTRVEERYKVRRKPCRSACLLAPSTHCF